MTLTNVAFASGLSSLIIVLIGWFLGLFLLNRYRSNPDKNTLALAIVLISIGSVWMAIGVNFLLALTGNSYLNEMTYMLLLGWIPGITGITLGYMFISIFKEEYTKITMFIFFLYLLADLLVLYILVPFGIGGLKISDVLTFKTEPNGIPDATVSGVWKIFTVISILIMILIALFFVVTALRTANRKVRARAGLMGFGLLTTTILLVFDSLLPPDQLTVLMSVRFGVMISLIIMSMGITLPRFIFGDLD